MTGSPLSIELAPWPSALLPALVVASAAAVAVWTLRRFYDRTPWPAVALFALLVAGAYGDVLARGRALLPLDSLRGLAPFGDLAPTEPHGNLLQGDLILLVHPARVAMRRAMGEGTWPLWNRDAGGGIPLLADPQAQALEPVELLLAPLPAVPAAGAAVALGTFLALLFAYQLLARLGAGAGPAAAGAVAYGLGGYLQLWAGWPLASTGVWLVATLYALALAMERGLRRDWGLLVATGTALLLAGHPETIAYALASLALVAAVRLGRLGPGGRRRRLGPRLAAAVLSATLLAAPALLPFAEALPRSLRWERALGSPSAATDPGSRETGNGGSAASGTAAGPATRLLQLAAPMSFGNDRYLHYWGHENINEDAAGFAGTLALLATLVALFLLLAHRRPALGRGETEATWLALGTVVVAALAAGASGRLALLLPLVFAVGTAATLERLRHGAESGTGGPSGTAVRTAALGLAAGTVVAWQLLAHRLGTPPGDPAPLGVLRHGFLLWHLRFLAGGVLLLGVAGWRRDGPMEAVGRLVRPFAAASVAAAIAAELLLAHLPANPPSPERLAFPVTPPLAHLRSELGAGEAAAGGLGPADPRCGRIAGLGPDVLPPALATVYGLADVRAYSPMAPTAAFDLLAPVLDGWDGEIPVLAPADSPVYDRLAVRFFLLAPGATCPAGTVVAFADRIGTVCRRPEASGALVGLAAGRIERAFETDAGTRIGLRLAPAAASRRLVTALPAAPGWRLLADGRPVVPEPGAFLAASLPPATRQVELLYRPPGFAAGLVAAALGLALAAAGIARRPALPPAESR